MGQIQSSVGLISGIPIETTVNQLISISARPRDLLQSRNQQVDAERTAVTSLSSLLLAFRFEASRLGTSTFFESKQASSSDTSAVGTTVTSGADAVSGSYQVTPLQTAASQQVISQRFETGTTFSASTFRIGSGDELGQGRSLEQLNGGTGVQRGRIRVTDRTGDSAIIDLRQATNVDDVIEAVNSATDINVTAEAVGDTFRLTDNTSGSGNLKVEEIGSGTTAADLGLSGIDTSSATADGTDIFTLYDGLELAALNDGNGVQTTSGDDITISLADQGDDITLSLGGSTTLGDVLDAINSADPARVSAAISSDGNRIELTDLTSGAGTFAVSSASGGTAAEDLGLTATPSGSTLTGDRLVAGLNDTLLRSLNGGSGVGDQQSISITDRSGASDTVDLSSAETLSEVLDAINAASVNVTATLNEVGNGIVLTDGTGGSASNLIIADVGGDIATNLGIVIDDTATNVDSGTLNRQSIGEATRLTTLNGGEGIDLGDFRITDSNGNGQTVDLNTSGSEAVTVGDVIDKINALSIGVSARINDTGDGILIVDEAGGSDTLTVSEVGNNTTAADLGLLREAVNGEVDGAQRRTIEIADGDTLTEIADKLNSAGADVSAAVIQDGTGQRLSITGSRAGAENSFLIDPLTSSLSFEETAAAQDALLLYGSADSESGGILLSSASNEFEDVVPGIKLNVNNGTGQTVTINVSQNTSTVSSIAQDFVDAYNSIRDSLDSSTAFDSEALTTGILFGTSVALRVDTELSQLATKRFFGFGDLNNLAQVGITVDSEGKLALDSSTLESALAADPDGVTNFFTDSERGVAAQFQATIDQLAGDDNSLLTNRRETLDRQFDSNLDRIGVFNERLDRERDRLLIQFFRLEETIAQLQDSQSVLNSLQAVPPLVSTG